MGLSRPSGGNAASQSPERQPSTGLPGRCRVGEPRAMGRIVRIVFTNRMPAHTSIVAPFAAFAHLRVWDEWLARTAAHEVPPAGLPS